MGAIASGRRERMSAVPDWPKRDVDPDESGRLFRGILVALPFVLLVWIAVVLALFWAYRVFFANG